MRSLILVGSFMLLAGIAQADCPLSGIKAAVYSQDQTYQGKQSPYVWYLNPCTMDAAPGEGACNPASGYFQEFDTQENGAGCQMSLTEIKKPWTYFSATVSGVSGYSGTFANTAGDRIADITILCDSTAGNLAPSGFAAADGTSPITWTITLKSDQACGNTAAPGAPPTPPPPTPVPIPTTTPAPPVPPGQTTATPVPFSTPTPPSPPQEKKGGCGGGCAFLIIIFIGPLVYVLIFVAWNFKNGKRGKELAPHPEFWMSVPGLIKDGCIFFAQKVCGLVDKIRGKGGSGGEGSYNEV